MCGNSRPTHLGQSLACSLDWLGLSTHTIHSILALDKRRENICKSFWKRRFHPEPKMQTNKKVAVWKSQKKLANSLLCRRINSNSSGEMNWHFCTAQHGKARPKHPPIEAWMVSQNYLILHSSGGSRIVVNWHPLKADNASGPGVRRRRRRRKLLLPLIFPLAKQTLHVC